MPCYGTQRNHIKYLCNAFIRCLIKCTSQWVRVTSSCIEKKSEWNEKMARYMYYCFIVVCMCQWSIVSLVSWSTSTRIIRKPRIWDTLVLQIFLSQRFVIFHVYNAISNFHLLFSLPFVWRQRLASFFELNWLPFFMYFNIYTAIGNINVNTCLCSHRALQLCRLRCGQGTLLVVCCHVRSNMSVHSLAESGKQKFCFL